MISSKTVIHVHEDDLELYLRGGLEPERIPIVESHLVECDTCRERFSSCLKLQEVLHVFRRKSDSARTLTERHARAGGEAMLQEIHPLSLDRQKTIIVNNSQNELEIRSPKAILPGTVVQLRIKDSFELGSVRSCSAPSNDGFLICLRLHDED